MRLKTLEVYEKVAGSRMLRSTVRVPAVECFGTWPVFDILSVEDRGRMAVLANELERA